VQKAIEGVLEAVTLKDMIERQQDKEQPMYHI
jgi:DNA-binding IscR family transcriptional regulator